MYLISIQKEQTNGLQPRTDSFVTEHSTISPNWPNDWAVFWVLICTDNLTVCSCHVTYPFQRESTLYSCLNVKELLAPGSREIWSLSECNWTRTYNYLFRKWTLNQEHTSNARVRAKIRHTCKHTSNARANARDVTRTYIHMHRTNKYSEHSSIG